MGIPRFYRWLAERFREVSLAATYKEEYQEDSKVNTADPNPNRIEFDCLYLGKPWSVALTIFRHEWNPSQLLQAILFLCSESLQCCNARCSEGWEKLLYGASNQLQ